MSYDWYDQAIEIVKRFDAYIVPLKDKASPMAKVNGDTAPPGKGPSKDPKQIQDWANKFPGYGVIPHKSFMVLDVDVKPGQYGKQSLAFLLNHGLDANTYTVRSPSGGLHLYYNNPTHFTIKQGVKIIPKFGDDKTQAEWDVLIKTFGEEQNTGLDIRTGWGYVAGPGSFKGDKEYSVILNLPLNGIPVGISFGGKAQAIANEAIKFQLPSDDVLPNSIKANRNDHSRQVTYHLALKGLRDEMVKDLITKYQALYNNDDGGAPTIDVMWDQYARAKKKVAGPLNNLLATKIFITDNQMVMDAHDTSRRYQYSDMVAKYANREMPKEITKLDGSVSVKMVNPVDEWKKHPDRLTVDKVVFSPMLKPGIVDGDSVDSNLFNLFTPPVVLDKEACKPTILGQKIYEACIQVIENVVTSPYDLDWFRKYVGIMVMDPTYRPAWHWHIFSNTRGIGKDTLSEMIMLLVGKSNTCNTGIEIFLDKSNVDLYQNYLVVLSDFVAVTDNNSSKNLLAKFKEVTGTSQGRARALYADATQMSCFARFIMLSNSYLDFPVDKGDRRIFKCESYGKVLSPGIYTLAYMLIKPDAYKVRGVAEYPEPQKEDLVYAKTLLQEYFTSSEWRDMYSQINCPANSIKEDEQAAANPAWQNKIESMIDYGSSIFKCDFVTHKMIDAMENGWGFKVPKTSTMIKVLCEAGVLKPVKLANGRDAKCIKMKDIRYDKDMDMLFEIDSALGNARIYTVRNHDIWSEKSPPYYKEIKDKILGKTLNPAAKAGGHLASVE